MASLALAKETFSRFAQARDFCLRGLPWVRKGLLAVIDQGLMAGSNFLLTILLARWLSAPQYGAYALAFSVFLLLGVLNESLITEPMMVFGPSWYRSLKREYLGSLLCIQGAIGLAFLLVLALSALLAEHFAFAPTFGSTLMGLSLSTPCVFVLWVARYAFYMEQTPGRAAVGAFLYCILVLSGTCVIYKRGLLSPCTAFLVIALAALITAAFNLLRLKPMLVLRGRTSPGPVWASHWNYGRWALGSAALKWIPGNISYSLTGAFLGMADVGALKALLNLLLPFSHATSSFSILFQPYVSGIFGKAGKRSTRAPVALVTLFFLASGLVYAASLTLLRYPILHLLYRGKFLEFAYLVPWVSVGIVLTTGSYGAVMGLRALQSPSSVFVASCAASAASLALGTMATWFLGLRGVVASLIISGLTMLVAASYLFHQRVKSPSGSPGETQPQFYGISLADAETVEQ